MNNLLKNAYIFFLYSEILCEISDNKAKNYAAQKKSRDILSRYHGSLYRTVTG